MLIYKTGVEAGWILDPGRNLLAVDNNRFRQESALTSEHDPVRARGTQVEIRRREDNRVELRCGYLGCVQGYLGPADWLTQAVKCGAGCSVIGHVPLEVEEAIVGCIEHTQPVGLRFKRHRGVGRTVDDWRVVELFHAR